MRTPPPSDVEPAGAPGTAPGREQALEERVRWLSTVAELGTVAHSGLKLQETLDRAVQAVSTTLGVEYAKILKLLPGGKEVLLVSGVGWKPGLVGEACVSTGLDSQAGYTLASAHPVVVDDLRAETRFSGPTLLHEHGVVSGLSVVIPGEDRQPWGVFGAHTKERRRFTQDHVQFLRAITNVVAGAVARDETEDALRDTKQVLEREVAQRTRALAEAVEDLQAFNAMVAHDLRAPLRAVEHLLTVLREKQAETLEEEASGLFDSVQLSTAQMRNLVDDLLALAQAGRDRLDMRDVDVTQLARERWERVRKQEPARTVKFVVQEGLTARADPHLLALVLDNLLSNALKFTRHVPRPVVEVGSKHLDVGGTSFYVRDNGAGFPTYLADKLFHPFRRLHAGGQYEGTGVGLATVRRIVERHGGSVSAHSAGPGEGATFDFRLLPAGMP